MPAPVFPRELVRVGSGEFKIVWQDGHESRFGARALRLACPCAACVDEWTGRRLVAEGAAPVDVRLDDARLVGNYAVQFVFSDGHSTGIFSFETLRGLCACPACRPRT